jgi:hypothetical protein
MDRSPLEQVMAFDPMCIKVKLAQQYGQEVIQPVCDKAKLFALMVGTKTLTRQTISQIKTLGYRVEVMPTEPKEL